MMARKKMGFLLPRFLGVAIPLQRSDQETRMMASKKFGFLLFEFLGCTSEKENTFPG